MRGRMRRRAFVRRLGGLVLLASGGTLAACREGRGNRNRDGELDDGEGDEGEVRRERDDGERDRDWIPPGHRKKID